MGENRKLTTEDIARICHETNRAYCSTLGDDSQVPWGVAPDWQRESARIGVRNAMSGASPQESHESWLAVKRADGWTYGEVKDPERKKHPCFVPYADLPLDQKLKDALFVAVVNAVRPIWIGA